MLAIILLIMRYRRKLLTHPVPGCPISSYYGERVINGVKQFHRGVDFACKIGTPVLAPWSGVVLRYYNDPLSGNTLFLALDNNLVVSFSHLTGSNVKQGDTVKEGQIIAYTGNTGSHSTGPHLHFVVRDENGNHQNPLIYLYS